jgi:hypothetical protein
MLSISEIEAMATRGFAGVYFLSPTSSKKVPFSLGEGVTGFLSSYGMRGLAVRTAETTSRIPRAVAAASS